LAIDALANQIEAPCAEASSLQSIAKLCGELADTARHGLCRPDGLGKSAADLDQRFGSDRFDRLGEATGRLIKTPAEFRAEAQR
jgi:hypothetical protein